MDEAHQLEVVYQGRPGLVECPICGKLMPAAEQVGHAANLIHGRAQDGRPAPYKDAAWLRQQYGKAHRTMQNIAVECGVAYCVILYWMKRHGIPYRDTHGS